MARVREGINDVDREFLYRFEDELNRARYEINEEYHMAISPTLQGLGKKFAQFKHDVEFEAAKLSTEVDAARAETMDTFTGATGVLAAHREELKDVKAFVAEVAQATNGGPPLDQPAAPVAPVADQVEFPQPGPPVSYP